MENVITILQDSCHPVIKPVDKNVKCHSCDKKIGDDDERMRFGGIVVDSNKTNDITLSYSTFCKKCTREIKNIVNRRKLCKKK